jgi:hypothetical protein
MKEDCTVQGLYRGPRKKAKNARVHARLPFLKKCHSITTMTFQTFLLHRGIRNDRKITRMHSYIKEDCTVLELYRGPMGKVQGTHRAYTEVRQC